MVDRIYVVHMRWFKRFYAVYIRETAFEMWGKRGKERWFEKENDVKVRAKGMRRREDNEHDGPYACIFIINLLTEQRCAIVQYNHDQHLVRNMRAFSMYHPVPSARKWTKPHDQNMARP